MAKILDKDNKTILIKFTISEYNNLKKFCDIDEENIDFDCKKENIYQDSFLSYLKLKHG